MPNLFGNYTPPRSGKLPKRGKKILSKVYNVCRKHGMRKRNCSRIAWHAVRLAGYRKKSYARR